MATAFTVDIASADGMRTAEWSIGEEFLIRPYRRGEDAEPAARVRLLAPGGQETTAEPASQRAAGPVTVAEVEERLALKSGGLPHPVLALTQPDGSPLATVYPEERVAWPTRFRVVDEHERPLADITHTPSRLGRRCAWRIDPADGGPPVVGRRGSLRGWLVFVLALPLWVVLFLGCLLLTLLTFGQVAEMVVWGCPRSITWRRAGAGLAGRAMTFGHLRTDYHHDPRVLERRLAYAQAALHNFDVMHHN
ncbi:hypothetical protein RM844_25320 [Streptomyces sp. DSM 44915]|uniref:Uncharacterized protein n=1 Tax=Streptomyces chisholmiae TaxID=3075540 RepID=A0ABU2JXB8_9ACTN|nr:hypothetical protein [Streptomyces sp. DSM 44915]MDT0269609.1 hypothetical protein [Streptomyces sp. DSM 44915]